jgi:two-component system, chemotaxis family, response regulator Rcp1
LRVMADGREVLQMLTGEVPGRENLDLIILDLNLPRHDGIEILGQLRELRLSHIPVVVLTSSDSPRDRQTALQLGAAKYLRKPSGLEQFLSLGAIFKEMLTPPEAAAEGQ